MLNKESSNKTSVKFTTPEMLINAVAQYYSLGKKKLLGSCRARSFSYPRQILMYMLRKEMGLGLVEIGRIVGGRDHTTVIHAVEKISHDLSINSRLREDIMGIKKIISV
jgi:chromosomal replication initiator protein